MIDNEFIKNTKLIEDGRDLNDWYIFRDKKHFGPFSYDEISDFIKSDLISLNHYIWRPGFESWTRVENLSELSCLQDSETNKKNLTDEDFQSLFAEEILVSEEFGPDVPVVQEKEVLEVKKSKNNFIGLSAVLAVALIGLSYLYITNSEEMYSFARLQDEQKSELEIISESPIQGSADIRFQSYLSKMNTGDPVIVFSTNLTKDSEIEYRIEGVGGSLVGLHRYNESIRTAVPEDKIFESKPLRRSSGEYIPAGVYSLFVSCLSCDKKFTYEDKIEYYPKGKIQYKKDLKQFNESVRYNASLEVSELQQIIATVKDQFQETKNGFDKKDSVSRWDNFSKQWLVDQEELINLFSQLQNNDLREKIYFLGLYEELQTIVRGLFEMHMIQDAIKNKKTDNKDYNKIVSEIEKSISAFKSKLNIAKLNLNKPEFISGR